MGCWPCAAQSDLVQAQLIRRVACVHGMHVCRCRQVRLMLRSARTLVQPAIRLIWRCTLFVTCRTRLVAEGASLSPSCCSLLQAGCKAMQPSRADCAALSGQLTRARAEKLREKK